MDPRVRDPAQADSIAPRLAVGLTRRIPGLYSQGNLVCASNTLNVMLAIATPRKGSILMGYTKYIVVGGSNSLELASDAAGEASVADRGLEFVHGDTRSRSDAMVLASWHLRRFGTPLHTVGASLDEESGRPLYIVVRRGRDKDNSDPPRGFPQRAPLGTKLCWHPSSHRLVSQTFGLAARQFRLEKQTRHAHTCDRS